MENNRRPPISLEGKICILLGLLGLLGVGLLQVLPHPYNDIVGWTLIWIAIIGAGALGVYHVVTTVEQPRYSPKAKITPMTPAEAGFLTAIGAAAVSLIALGLRHRLTAAIAALIACIGVSFDFVDRHWFAVPQLVQRPLTADNARMEVVNWAFAWSNQNPHQYIANIYTSNIGKTDAIGMQNLQIMLLSPIPVQDEILSGYFAMLKAQLSFVKTKSHSQIHPKQPTSTWFTTFSDPQLTDAQVAAINSGALYPYAISVMRYKDDVISDNEFIYTESCAFHLGTGAIGNCERGNNVSYIAN